MATPLILLDDIAFSYNPRHAPVLKNVDFELPKGGITALVGRSGAGKSSLLHIIAGLARPTDGQVFINGVKVKGPMRQAVMMFQSPSLYPWLTVARNVALGLRFARLPKQEITRRVQTALELVGLTEEANRKSSEISGGQAQRVALARSLVMEPEVLLLDEPFAALDLFTRRSLQKDVRAIAERLGITVVLVSHDIGEVARMADRAIFLGGRPGTVLADVPVDAAVCRDATGLARESERLAALYHKISGVPAEVEPTSEYDMIRAEALT